MLLHSIRWRLQLWHGLLLVCVLAGFGFTAYQLERANQLRRIDRELQLRAGVVASALRSGGPRGRPPADRPGPEAPAAGRPASAGQGREFPPPPRDLRMGEGDLALFNARETNGFYFVLWLRDGRELTRSDSAPEEIPLPHRVPGEDSSTRMRGPFREHYHHTPPGECILVGRDLGTVVGDLHRLGWLLAGVGAAVLAAGLAGGWWLSTRAIRPIADITATAAQIAGGDLTRRIPATDADNELGQLAAVLNSTFARLEAAFAQQARFTSDAAHELRTPVTVMLTQTQSALNRDRPAAEYRETIEACQRAAQRMRGLIESLLSLARLDAGQESIQSEPFDLAAVAAECMDLVRPLAAERDITLHAALPPVRCAGAPERVAQVITNLLTNAIHYNRDGGEVHVALVPEGGQAVLTVCDTGAGIGAEDLPHIFERFYRADKSRAHAAGRAGLGLAIAKAIVEAHGGSIVAASQPGEGSTFTVRLPAAGDGPGSN